MRHLGRQTDTVLLRSAKLPIVARRLQAAGNGAATAGGARCGQQRRVRQNCHAAQCSWMCEWQRLRRSAGILLRHPVENPRRGARTGSPLAAPRWCIEAWRHRDSGATWHCGSAAPEAFVIGHAPCINAALRHDLAEKIAVGVASHWLGAAAACVLTATKGTPHRMSINDQELPRC